MTIKADNSSGLIAVGSTDTTVLNNTSNGRWTVKSISLHDHSGSGDTVDLFKSSDATSAAAERIDQIVLAANETKQVVFVPVEIPSGYYLIANATTGARVNTEAVYTARDGAS